MAMALGICKEIFVSFVWAGRKFVQAWLASMHSFGVFFLNHAAFAYGRLRLGDEFFFSLWIKSGCESGVL